MAAGLHVNHGVATSSTEGLGAHHPAEINNHCASLQRKEMSSSGFLGFGRDRSAELANNLTPALQEQHVQFQQQLIQLKQQQQLQQQLLFQHFQQQQQQLAEQHEKQLQDRIKKQYEDQLTRDRAAFFQVSRLSAAPPLLQDYLEQQQKMEEAQKMEKERRDKERLEQLKKKEKHEQSAIASSEVKQRLQEFVLSKKQREAAANSASNSPPNRKWHPLLGKYDDDFPLRKTVDGTSKTDSSPGSPANGASIHSLPSSNGRTPIQEEPGTPPFPTMGPGSVGDLTLYSSPSMPNISLGRPPVPSGTTDAKTMPAVSETQVRAMAAVSLGMPLTTHMLHSTLPFCPALPVIDGEFTPPTSPGYMQQQIKVLERSSGPGQTGTVSLSLIPGVYPPGSVITDAQVAQARLHRTIHRPLGRTQSAPLPLGHPMLQRQAIMLSPPQSEQYLREKQLFEQQQQHNLLKQHIRQTVLTRASSKNQVENVEEETEAAMAQEMRDSAQPEVIDLTEGRTKEGEDDSELVKQQREREAFLQQQRDLMARHSLQVAEELSFAPRNHVARPLSRALSSPLVSLSPAGSPQDSPVSTRHTFTTGLVYDSLMLKHQCICGDNSYHPEHGGRLQSIWARLQETGLLSKCERIRSRKATIQEIQSCHSETYSLLFGTNPLNRQKLDVSKLADLPIKNFVMLPCGGIGVDSDTTWNELHTASAARMAAGCITELSLKVANGEVKNGLAVVRPPGHHAEHQQAMGFCFFNSVAIAAKQLIQRLKLEKVLIVDWDVHHGNGLQQIFYDDPHILYISLHRHDDGNFFPGTGGPQEVGVDDGIGFNINIAWSGSLNPPMGDAEYIAAFRTIVMPIARDFDPEIVLVAAGFDAAAGHHAPLGGYRVSPACFGYMTKQLMQLAKGKVVLALEGGYDLPAICDCSQECVTALLGDECAPLKEEEATRKPCQVAVEVLQRTVSVQAPHWPCIKRWAHTIGYSLVEAQQKEKEEVETVTALASLSMAVPHGHIQSPKSSTSQEDPEEPMEEDLEK